MSSITFTHEGSSSTDRRNRRLAGYLAFLGGYVNAIGFALLGVFTSHVTGDVGRFGSELAGHHEAGGTQAIIFVLTFFGGALVASMIVESDFFGVASRSYLVATSVEALLLVSFGFSERFRFLSWEEEYSALALSFAMGMHNSLITRLSGAVVRTTHLTGVVTDLGIELARWFRWGREQLTKRFRLRLAFGRTSAARPSPAKIIVLWTVAGGFLAGTVVGTLVARAIGRHSAFVPAAALVAAGVYLSHFFQRTADSQPPPNSRG